MNEWSNMRLLDFCHLGQTLIILSGSFQVISEICWYDQYLHDCSCTNCTCSAKWPRNLILSLLVIGFCSQNFKANFLERTIGLVGYDLECDPFYEFEHCTDLHRSSGVALVFKTLVEATWYKTLLTHTRRRLFIEHHFIHGFCSLYFFLGIDKTVQCGCYTAQCEKA